MIAESTASHWIDGRPAQGTGPALPVLFPLDGSEIATVREAAAPEIEAALAAAARAQPQWAALRPVERGRILTEAARLIRANAEELAQLETLDTGKPIQETRVADWPSGADALEFFGGLAAGITGQHIPLGTDWAYTRREALGVCLGIGAWNYPSQIACWKTAPALAMGNAMIFKPSEETPLGALRLAAILADAGLPPGIFQVLNGGRDLGAALIGDPRIAKVSLTGSVETGRKVYTAAASGMRHVTMELGGKSPLIVFDDASLEDAVGAAILANFYSSGQICSNGTRVLLHEDIAEAFLAQLAERAGRLVMGDPRDEATQLGPLISAGHTQKVRAAITAGIASGARLVCGGVGEGPFVPPTVFVATDDNPLATNEIFGPVLTALTFRTEDEALARANALPYGLAAGVFTRDLARAHRVAAGFEAGTVWINAYNLTPVEMPFGGVKQSGIGRENAAAAIEHYSQLKTVYVGMGPVEAPV